ncbi:hypothetical protein [Streptomyces aureoversilis]|uniref:ACGX-repeat peptide n=1 Tax=Streptomyces aureoversilis TaxID=67277 RepID=A0ABW0A8N9_9ACTN
MLPVVKADADTLGKSATNDGDACCGTGEQASSPGEPSTTAAGCSCGS